GLIPDLTANAAKNAALGAGAKVEKVYAGTLNNNEIIEIQSLNPDIILLCGGTDGGNEKVVCDNAKKIASSKINSNFLFAGNKVAVDSVTSEFIFHDKKIDVAENVMPEIGTLNIESVQSKIRTLFLDNIIQAKGIESTGKDIDSVLMPTPMSILNATKLIADGTKSQKGWGNSLVVDLGGATTDIHSAADGEPSRPNVTRKGLPEPYLKRTVEGDLGMRYCIEGIIDGDGLDIVVKDCGFEKEKVEDYCSLVKKNPAHLPVSSKERRIERSLAKVAVEIAANRHVGTLKNIYTPMGEVFVQSGKDLSDVSIIIGTGGAIIESDSPYEILKNIAFNPSEPFSLRPKSPTYYLDKDYILFAIGLLNEVDPNIAFRIAQKSLAQLKQ
ncbi:MAG: MutL protein, partial [Desulfobacterales bacterium]|nr:MutL protein [Desulfobacterales bacterium]